MIHCFATSAHQHLLREFLDSWSPADNARLRAIAYEKFPCWKPLPSGVCIFTDLERLLPDELALATRLADALRAFPEHFSVFNDPGLYAGRFNLLNRLHNHGSNDFSVRRLDGLENDLRFPVFVRNELDHDGPITPLLQSRDELNRVLEQKQFQAPARHQHLMVVEYCDCTESDGLFRKYSVMNVAGTLIPRHVLFSDNWSTKKPDFVSEKTIAAETDFMENFPHTEQVLKIFQLAGLDYGRIDYGLRQGRLQVWEINTNPTIVPRRATVDPRRLPLQARSAQQIIETLRRLAERHAAGSARPFRSANFLKHRMVQFFKNLRRHDRR